MYDRYISPIADTYAWVLMPNHFHLLVRIKENVVYKYSKDDCFIDADRNFDADRSVDAVRSEEARFEELKWKTIDLSACEASDSVAIAATKTNNIKIPKAHLHFSHLFSAYSKYFNTYTGRHGSLFERPFDRKEIADKEYFKNLVVYIHNNPVHHKFTEHAMDYPWSSYLTCLSLKQTHLQRDAVIGWFDNEANFRTAHDGKMNEGKISVRDIELWLELN
ncbi:MAG TPA: hypothetical protein VGK38_04335 [Prolixibacteraceae bacterium]